METLFQTLFHMGMGFALGAIFYMYMKSNRYKKGKRKYYARLSRHDGYRFSTSSGENVVSSDIILASMKRLYDRDGIVLIEFMDDEEIQVTSLDTTKDEFMEYKLNEIKEMIRENLLKEGDVE